MWLPILPLDLLLHFREYLYFDLAFGSYKFSRIFKYWTGIVKNHNVRVESYDERMKIERSRSFEFFQKWNFPTKCRKNCHFGNPWNDIFKRKPLKTHQNWRKCSHEFSQKWNFPTKCQKNCHFRNHWNEIFKRKPLKKVLIRVFSKMNFSIQIKKKIVILGTLKTNFSNENWKKNGNLGNPWELLKSKLTYYRNRFGTENGIFFIVLYAWKTYTWVHWGMQPLNFSLFKHQNGKVGTRGQHAL